ncbi:hypothetical protein HY621_02990 [Candidatus Uhrbacteria bacterium]|nr:hypothetical protein [Candidatus Uhrbacteria bacterium]
MKDSTSLLQRVVNSWKRRAPEQDLTLGVPAIPYIKENYDMFNYDEVFSFIIETLKKEREDDVRDATLPALILYLKDKKRFLKDLNEYHRKGKINENMIDNLYFWCSSDGLYFGRLDKPEQNNPLDPQYRRFLNNLRDLYYEVKKREEGATTRQRNRWDALHKGKKFISVFLHKAI